MFIYNVFHAWLNSPCCSHTSTSQLQPEELSLHKPWAWAVPCASVATVRSGLFCHIAARCNDLLSSCKYLYFFCSPSVVYKPASLHAAGAGIYWAFWCYIQASPHRYCFAWCAGDGFLLLISNEQVMKITWLEVNNTKIWDTRYLF